MPMHIERGESAFCRAVVSFPLICIYCCLLHLFLSCASAGMSFQSDDLPMTTKFQVFFATARQDSPRLESIVEQARQQ
jgi:hypothetical protein